MFVRCASGLSGATHPGGICSLILPDCTAPGDEKKIKTNKKKEKNHETNASKKYTMKERERKIIEIRGLKRIKNGAE